MTTFKVKDLFDAQSLFLGTIRYSVNTDGTINNNSKPEVLIKGMITQSGVTEGLKSDIHEVYIKINEGLIPINTKLELLKKEYTFDFPLTDEVKESDKFKEFNKSLNEIAESEVAIDFIKIPFSKVENLSFDMDYQILYKSFFDYSL